MRPDQVKPVRRRLRRPEIDMTRARFALPSGFTLANLFFGIFAIVSASRGEIDRAVLFIVLGGVCDAFDGRVARATRSGSEFGEQLDSLVDAITFGLAPAMITYFNVMGREGWDWVLVWIYCACAVLRLARFNVTQAGASKSYFVGLPSPAAGGTLATYHWFANTELYRQTMIADLPWHQWVRWLMVALSFLMISNIRYPAVPLIGWRSLKQILGTLVVLVTLWGVIFHAKEFLFPFGVAFVLYGLVTTVFIGLLDMRPTSAAARERALREAYDRPEYALATEELLADDDTDDVEFEAQRTGGGLRPAGAAALSERESRDREARRRARKERERPERPERKERADRPERAERAERPERAERAERPERGDRGPRSESAPVKGATAADADAEASEKSARDRRAERRERQRERQRERRAARDAREAAPVSIVPGGEAPPPAPVPAAHAPPPLELDLEGDEVADAGDGAESPAGPEVAERKRRKRRRKRRERGLPESAPPDPAATFSPDDPIIPPRAAAAPAAGERPTDAQGEPPRLAVVREAGPESAVRPEPGPASTPASTSAPTPGPTTAPTPAAPPQEPDE